MTDWPRSNDALIAERAEGRTVYKGNDWTGNPYDLYWVHVEPNGSGQCPVPVPHYNTDLAAITRAMEAWRAQEPGWRSFSIESDGDGYIAKCRRRNEVWDAREDEIAHACAAALLLALKGSHAV